MKKIIAALMVLLILVPMTLTSCQTAAEREAQQKEFDEISKLAESYMNTKYSRQFTVKKCEYAVGEEHDGDYFLTLTNGTHVYYDTDEDKFYDDKQADLITSAAYNELWMPIVEHINGKYDNGVYPVFGFKYVKDSGNDKSVYSLFHELYDTNIKLYLKKERLSVTTDKLYIVAEDASVCKNINDYITDMLSLRFYGQSKGDLRVFVVSSDCAASNEFNADSLDVTDDGFIAELRFGKITGITLHQYIDVGEGISAMLCNYDSNVLEEGDVKLVPVSDSDTAEKNILSKIDENADGLVNSILKARSLSRESSIYQIELSERAAKMLDNGATIALSINQNDENTDKSNNYGLYAYNMNGDTYNISCLSSYSTQCERVELNNDSDWYLWLGQKPSIFK